MRKTIVPGLVVDEAMYEATANGLTAPPIGMPAHPPAIVAGGVTHGHIEPGGTKHLRPIFPVVLEEERPGGGQRDEVGLGQRGAGFFSSRRV